MHTSFRHMNPVLPSTDVARDIRWYTEKMGFQEFFSNTDHKLNRIDYAGLSRQGLCLHLQFQWPDDMARMNGSAIRIQVENIGPLFQEFVERGSVAPDVFRENTPWGTNEFGLYDPNRNAIFFYEDVSSGIAQKPAPVLPPGKWFERPFDFEHLSVSPQGLLERLRDTPLRLYDLRRSFSPAQLVHQPAGQWSAQENIGHLLDLEPLWYGRIHDITNGEKTMRPADLTNRKTHEAGHNAVPVEKLLAEFAAERHKLVERCTTNSAVLETAAALHPRLQKPMRMIDLMYFVAEHDDHHIAVIRHLRSFGQN
ncbi:MAG: DinB family protein [Saprospiraceae bacterium]